MNWVRSVRHGELGEVCATHRDLRYVRSVTHTMNTASSVRHTICETHSEPDERSQVKSVTQ